MDQLIVKPKTLVTAIEDDDTKKVEEFLNILDEIDIDSLSFKILEKNPLDFNCSLYSNTK